MQSKKIGARKPTKSPTGPGTENILENQNSQIQLQKFAKLKRLSKIALTREYEEPIFSSKNN